MTRVFECIRASIPAWAALAALAILPAAQADTRPVPKKLVTTVRVPYADLDLTQREDAQALLGRIKKAAFRACGGDPRRHPNYDMMPGRVEAAYRACREEAVARAIATFTAPALAQAQAAPSM